MKNEISIDDELILHTEGVIARLSINRPDTRSPLGHARDGERFSEAANIINGNKNLRCVIITGA